MLEPFGPGGGSFVQDLAWLFIGWLYNKDLSDFPNGYDPDAECIKYRDELLQEWCTCTHQPNFKTFYSAWHRIQHDSLSGELGVKVMAQSEYAAQKRSISGAVIARP